jgi:hypothetical protein
MKSVVKKSAAFSQSNLLRHFHFELRDADDKRRSFIGQTNECPFRHTV